MKKFFRRGGGQPQEGALCYLKGATGGHRAAGSPHEKSDDIFVDLFMTTFDEWADGASDD